MTTIVGESDVSGIATGVLQSAMPTIEALEGFKGVLVLQGNEGRVVLGVTFWQTEEAMRESERVVGVIRRVESASHPHTSLEIATFEVVALELS
jgi:heme-degrading monooxygenase HmoA